MFSTSVLSNKLENKKVLIGELNKTVTHRLG